MRNNDFTKSDIKKALEKANNRCERCWKGTDLDVHHIVPICDGGHSTPDNSAVLCVTCHNDAPHDEFLFKNLFLRFASSKEMIQYYNTLYEPDALVKWRIETGYSKKIKLRTRKQLVKEKMRNKAKNGGYLGFNIPYGYDYRNKALNENVEEAKIVKEIYSYYLKGLSMGKIAKHLNRINAPTKRGGTWAKRTISKILKNPLYYGAVKWDGIITSGSHEALIDEKIYKDVQKMINKRRLGSNLVVSS